MTKVSRWAHYHWPLKPESPDPLRQNPIASVLKRENAPRHAILKPMLTPSSDLLEITPARLHERIHPKKLGDTLSPIFPCFYFVLRVQIVAACFPKLNRSLFLPSFLGEKPPWCNCTFIMSKAASLPPWEVMPSWEKRPAAPPVVQKEVRFAHLENTFIPPLPPPPPEPVTAPPATNAHRRAISLPKNPRPVRPRLPSSPRPTEKSNESTNESSPIEVADPPPIPATADTRPKSRGRSSTLPGTVESSPSSTSRPPLSLSTSYPTPPSSTKSPVSPQKPLENIKEDNAFPSYKILPPPPPPPPPQIAISIGNNNDYNDNYKAPAPARKSRFNALKRSLSLKILPQSSNGRRSPSTLSATVEPQSPNPPTPDIPPSWQNTIVPTSSLRRKKSKQLTSPAYNGEVFAWIETEGSRVVSIGDDKKEVSEYLARSPRTGKAPSGPSPASTTNAPKSLHVRQRSRRLASPGYVQEKYSLVESGSRSRDTMRDVVVSGGRSPGIPDEEMRANRDTNPPAIEIEGKAIPTRPQRPERPGRPDDSTFDILDMYDEEMRPSTPKPEPPPKESSSGPRLIPLKYAYATSPKEAAPAGPAPPKLIPLKFLSPPSPEESEDDSFPYAYESVDDVPDGLPIEVAPLRIKSSENTPTSERNNVSAPRTPNNNIGSPTQTFNTQSPTRRPENISETITQAPTSLTAHLVSRAAPRKLYSATHSTFLRCCSDGRITVPVLSRYLTQERIFLEEYVRFLALLLANVSIPSRPAHRLASPSRSSSPTKADREINARLTPHLITRLSHAQNQLSLFSNMEPDIQDLNLESWEEATEDGMTDATRMLVRLFDVIGTAVEKGEKSVLVGVVVLWVREKAHLEAWKEVQSTLTMRNSPHQPDIPTESPAASLAVQNYLLPCFSGNESLNAMEELTRLLDEVWCDRYVNEGTGFNRSFEERASVKSERRSWEEKGWEEMAKEGEEMMEMVLGITARGWPGLEGR
ncbi:hypothetical protein N431DRAFT_425533 [Stipitochalara longipes BDJ]|nr:hypothetical protein N431DRAFT_425533 [Stipitochalara longipes BDJ]